MVLFGTAGIILTGMAVDAAVVNNGDGTGFYLSGGIVALAAAAGYLVPLHRALLTRA
jgi:hypothetical protein